MIGRDKPKGLSHTAIPSANSAAKLPRIIKSARDTMRKDKGLNGDLDRLPQLVWIMFLKLLDDVERVRETESDLSHKPYQPIIQKPYRWRDWAANPGGITGDALISFVNNDETARPDGTRGPGLLAYLRSLHGSQRLDSRDVVANVFRGVTNRMLIGYLLRDVINKIDEINFSKTAETHVLSSLYESILKELRDAAGDSGEFYTPRPIVRLMVELVDPRLGEMVLDPAAGTGGFLVESYLHLEKQCKSTSDYEQLQTSILGIEAKSLPYLLCQMNLMLHGIEFPSIDPLNALRFPLSEIGERDRVDVVLTNPPFGGEEEKGILSNFPADKQTSETALLFLQLIMRRLRRTPRPGRAAVIVPNGTLYDDGVAELIRADLAKDFNLHMVLRFPKGVFEPYTDIATNILFFETGGPTEYIWFYEHPLPPRRAHLKGKSYSATDGVQYEEFAPLLAWWSDRKENDQAWRIKASEIEEDGFDLNQNHPKHAKLSLLSPQSIIKSIRTSKDISEGVLRQLEATLGNLPGVSAEVSLRDLLTYRKEFLELNPDTEYTRARVQLHFRGAKVRDRVFGSEIGTKRQVVMHTSDLVMSRIDARNGAMALVPSELDGAIATNDFPVFEIETGKVVPSYLRYCLFQPAMLSVYEYLSRGSTNRRRLMMEKFLDLKIPLPTDLDIQQETADTLRDAEEAIGKLQEQLGGIEEDLEDLIAATLQYVFKGQNIVTE